MNYYNGTEFNGDIKEFKVSKSKDGYVYATTSRLVALTYIARVYPNTFTTIDGQECFLEIVPNFFENSVKGRSGYLYTLEETNFKPVEQSNKCGHAGAVRTAQDVKVKSVEYIEDIYSELLKYIKSGQLQIKKFDSLDKNYIKNLLPKLIELNKTSTINIPTNRIDLIEEYLAKNVTKEE